eukprot:gene15573-32079_t
MEVNNDNNGNQGQKPIVMKIRLSYTGGAGPVNQDFVVNGFPST